MKILAVNTAGVNTEIALLNDGERRFFRDTDFRRASVALMPEVERMLDAAGVKPSDLDALAVVVGPGSFTGIRIGVSSVRAMAYALDKPVVTVNLLEVLAYNRGYNGRTVSVCDAGNGYCYIATFDAQKRPETMPACMTLDEAAAFIAALDGDFVVSADSVLSPRFGDCAAGQGLIDAVEAHRNETVGFADVVPLYIRVSQAELCK